MLTLAVAWLLAASPAIDNDFVRVTRGETPCAVAGTPGCGHRVIVALGPIELTAGNARHRLDRGKVAVFAPGESYAVQAGGDYFEVAVRPDHPAPLATAEVIAPEKNALLYDNEDFFVFEEKLEPGDTRARHSHSQRVVIQLNRTRLRQWPDGAAELLLETVPGKPSFSPPVIHKVANVGDLPLFGIIIEFKPAGAR